MANVLREELVDRDARVNVRPGSFLDANAGQERATGSGVIARSVGSGSGIAMVQSRDDLELVFDFIQRLHRPIEREILSFTIGPPTVLDGAIGEVNESRPQRSSRR